MNTTPKPQALYLEGNATDTCVSKNCVQFFELHLLTLRGTTLAKLQKVIHFLAFFKLMMGAWHISQRMNNK